MKAENRKLGADESRDFPKLSAFRCASAEQTNYPRERSHGLISPPTTRRGTGIPSQPAMLQPRARKKGLPTKTPHALERKNAIKYRDGEERPLKITRRFLGSGGARLRATGGRDPAARAPALPHTAGVGVVCPPRRVGHGRGDTVCAAALVRSSCTAAPRAGRMHAVARGAREWKFLAVPSCAPFFSHTTGACGLCTCAPSARVGLAPASSACHSVVCLQSVQSVDSFLFIVRGRLPFCCYCFRVLSFCANIGEM